MIPFDQWPLRKQNSLLAGVRNHLTDDEQNLVIREREMIANELRVWLPDEEREAFRRTPFAQLIRWNIFAYGGNFGMAIRNEYELWLEGHHITEMWRQAEKLIPMSMLGADAVDLHPCHPDNFSFSCMELLWEKLQ